jgi:hypothetical protein
MSAVAKPGLQIEVHCGSEQRDVSVLHFVAENKQRNHCNEALTTIIPRRRKSLLGLLNATAAVGLIGISSC